LAPEIEEEVFPIAFPDASSEPGAVVVIGGDALLTRPAVFRPQGLLYAAHRAVPYIDVYGPWRQVPPQNLPRAQSLLKLIVLNLDHYGLLILVLLIGYICVIKS